MALSRGVRNVAENGNEGRKKRIIMAMIKSGRASTYRLNIPPFHEVYEQNVQGKEIASYMIGSIYHLAA